ncbi:hypothetical protein [Nocardioides sp. SYSU DS0663]|uniref:hypothetical protein n=1 Tax=Nocardioides sp. SYSU DS0663 TaxID=3416445 RepID=UPI003F4C81B5
MRSLLRVELTRLRWRRAVVLLLVGCVVAPAVIAIATAWNTRPTSEGERAGFLASSQREIARCEKHPRQYGVRPARAADRCEERILGWHTGRQPLTLARERGASGTAVVGVLTLLLMLAATTFVGHDWNSGSVSNQLLFRPRRGRVWAAKAAVVTGVSLVVAAAVSTAYWLALWAVVRSRDQVVVDGGLTDSLLLGVRGAGFAAAAALGCYALTMLLRSTVATLGVIFAVGVAGVFLFAALGIPGQWQPQENAAAVVRNGATYHVDIPEHCYRRGAPQRVEANSECDSLREISPWHGVGYFGVPLLGVGVASVVSFRRRDVP